MYDAHSLMEYLDERRIRYRVDHHARAYTALETAEARHVSGKLFAKTVVITDGRDLFCAIVPAHLDVDIDKLKRLVGKKSLRLADEGEFQSRFPDCEVGAMAPFGHLFGLDLFIDDDLAVVPEVTFNAYTHQHTMTLSGKDFLKASEGVVGDFSKPRDESC